MRGSADDRIPCLTGGLNISTGRVKTPHRSGSVVDRGAKTDSDAPKVAPLAQMLALARLSVRSRCPGHRDTVLSAGGQGWPKWEAIDFANTHRHGSLPTRMSRRRGAVPMPFVARPADAHAARVRPAVDWVPDPDPSRSRTYQ